MVTMRQQIIDNAVAHGVDRAAVTAYIDKLLAIPKKVPPTKLDVDTATALAKISSLQGYLNRLHGKNITLTVTQQGSANKLLGMQGRANGGITAHAMGSITAFAGGGENHVAQIAPAGAMRLWAEPETGGEAYIPLARSKRARSTAILNEVAQRFGVGGQQGGGTVRLDDHTIRALGREIAARPTVLDSQRISQSVDRQLGAYR